MPLLQELATYLQAAGLGTVSSTLFMGALPLDDPATGGQDACIAVIPVPGLPPVHAHDGTRYEQPVVQILTRGVPHHFAAAWDAAMTAWEVLDGVSNQALSGVNYLWIQALQSPWRLRIDDYHRSHIVFNVRCARVL